MTCQVCGSTAFPKFIGADNIRRCAGCHRAEIISRPCPRLSDSASSDDAVCRREQGGQ